MGARLTVDAYTTDVDRLRRFYESGLGVKPSGQGTHWLPWSLGGATFALHGAEGEPSADLLQRWNLSFEVDDIEAAFERFRAQGAIVLRGVADVEFGKEAILRDPDGRTFWLVSTKL